MNRFLLPLSDYNRIHQVAYGVLRDVGRAEKACIFFACFGALILSKHYKIPARPVAGGFALCVNDAPEVAFFGQRDGDRVAASATGFHMWVQTETHIVDFMAPIYPEAFADADRAVAVPRRMFQRTIASEAPSLDDLKSPGDFFTLPEAGLTDSLLDGFFAKPASSDLVGVAEAWFGGRHKTQKSTLQMGDSHGETYRLTLPNTRAALAW